MVRVNLYDYTLNNDNNLKMLAKFVLRRSAFVCMFFKRFFRRFKSKIPYIIRDIFEGLAQDPPDELVTPSKRVDQDESFEQSDLDSVANSDFDANYSSNQR